MRWLACALAICCGLALSPAARAQDCNTKCQFALKKRKPQKELEADFRGCVKDCQKRAADLEQKMKDLEVREWIKQLRRVEATKCGQKCRGEFDARQVFDMPRCLEKCPLYPRQRDPSTVRDCRKGCREKAGPYTMEERAGCMVGCGSVAWPTPDQCIQRCKKYLQQSPTNWTFFDLCKNDCLDYRMK
jgi:hypothetical protein